ncbi:MAG: carboxypeptidase regulatory-like domain-containing protein [Candidatus Methanosuratincola sp.]|jgi:hypothetical protein|nr:carboxypeptidase-like regulatory domain-containing protein [Candidatus Methanosuratincola sp.]
MSNRKSSMLAFVLLTIISIQLVAMGSPVYAEVPTPTKLKIYVAPPKVLADNNVYETIFVQLQDSKGLPARAVQDTEIYLSSSSIYVGTVDPVITIRAGETYAVAKFYSTYTPGTTTITATASGFQTVQASMTTVGPIPNKLVVHVLPEALPADNSQYSAVVVQLQDSSGTPAKAPIGNVNVSLFSSNTTVGTVEPYVIIPSGSTYGVAKFKTTNTSGSTTVTAIASGYVTGSATVKTQSYNYEATKLAVYISPSKVPADGIVYDVVAVQLKDSKGNIAKAASNVVVSLSSSNTGVGTVTGSITIPVGQSFAIARFNSTFKAGTTTITATATNLITATQSITTVGPVPSKLSVYCVPSSLPADNRQYSAVVVQLQDSSGNPAKDPEGDVLVDLFSSKPDFGVPAPRVVIPYGTTYAVATFNSTFLAGSTDLTAQSAGYYSAQARMTTSLIDEIPLTVALSAEPATVDSEAKSTVRILVKFNNTAPAPGVTIKLSSSSGGTFSAITNESNGNYSVVFTAPKVSSSTMITITANATKTGYITGYGSTNIIVVPSVQTGKGSLRLYVRDNSGNPVSAATVTSTSQPSGASPVSSITDQNGLASFNDIAAGTYVFSVTREGYETKSFTLTVNANQTSTLTVAITKIETPFSNLLIWIVGIAIAAVVAGAIIFMLMRRRKKK